MLAFLKALLLLPIAIAVILLAIANRAPVTFSFDPVSRANPELAVTVPLYALLLAAVALGVLIGGIGAWLSSGDTRRSGRAARREAHRLRAEADQLRARAAAAATGPKPGNPALPSPQAAR